MPRKRLQELLAELRAELAASEALDAQSRESLRRLSDEIDRTVLAEPAGTDGASALETVRDATLRVESRHPRLAQLLGQIGDTLGKLGI